MACARVRLPPDLEYMPTSALLELIDQANLGRTDAWIVENYIIQKTAQDDLAAELKWSRKTVSAHLKKSLRKMSKIAEMLHGDLP